MRPLVNGKSNRARELQKVFGEFPANHEPPSFAEDVQVRPYRASDRPEVRKICCDTGFLGDPIDSVFQDRELFADLFTGAYLDREPEWALVAEDKGRVVGYLLGSVRNHFDLVLMRQGLPVASKMIWKLLAGHYQHHPRSRRFVRWLFTAGYHEQPKHPTHAAHLHLDLAADYRGRGIGRRLWHTYEQQLRSAGVKACFGAFFSHPGRRPEGAYARFGFSVFDRKPTTLFQPEICNVEVVCVSKSLVNGEHVRV
jgi:ribosomal protein S18 acetylase RimI-like enzyme